jgi:hypothetical protein
VGKNWDGGPRVRFAALPSPWAIELGRPFRTRKKKAGEVDRDTEIVAVDRDTEIGAVDRDAEIGAV